MTIEEFWTLIHRSSAETTSKDERTKWLTVHLAQLPVAEIIAFELHLAEQRRRVDTCLMWGAAWHIMQGWCSEDGFWYFQPWLVGLGREAFEQAAGNPDALADNPQIRRLAGPATRDHSGPTMSGLNGNSSTTSPSKRTNWPPGRMTAWTTH